MTREDIVNPEEEILVWPEHWQALELFTCMLTQWRTGFNGATGLDYAALPVVFELNGIEKEQQRERFDELQIMERAALKAIRNNEGGK